VGLNLDLKIGQTPLDPEETVGLLIPSISVKRELDEFEQFNIEKAIKWTLRKKIKKEELLSDKFIKRLHERMFGEVWDWAGQFRQTEKNIGVSWHQIPGQLRALLDDCSWWIENKTFEPNEIAVRFKHRLVSIHCFANGNGRHSRLMANLLAEKVLEIPFFTWNNGSNREMYIKSLKAADLNDLKPLLQFARS
jgi:Fic-DOC domain mobile mystery protein B